MLIILYIFYDLFVLSTASTTLCITLKCFCVEYICLVFDVV